MSISVFVAHSCSTSDQEKGASRGKWRAEGRVAEKRARGCERAAQTDLPRSDRRQITLSTNKTIPWVIQAPEGQVDLLLYSVPWRWKKRPNIKEANQVNHDPNK